ncbi:MAG: hypothetical protein WKG07_07575 [Hymenobacter sp.]
MGVWVLVWPTAARGGAVAAPLPYVLWGGLLAVIGLWCASFFIGIFGLFTQIPGQYAYAFFWMAGPTPGCRGKPTQVHYQRGQSLLVGQYYSVFWRDEVDWRTVCLTPLTSLFYWASPLPAGQWSPAEEAELARQGWVPVDRPIAWFGSDPAEQRRLDGQRAREKAEARRDSLEAERLYGMSEAVRRDADNNAALRAANGGEDE